MDLMESLLVGLFCFTVVFSMLGGLYLLIKISNGVIKLIATKDKK